MSSERFEITPVAGHLGAEVRGVDLAACDDAAFAALRTAVAEHLVVFVRGQALTREGQLSLARRFGKPEDQELEGFDDMDLDL